MPGGCNPVVEKMFEECKLCGAFFIFLEWARPSRVIGECVAHSGKMGGGVTYRRACARRRAAAGEAMSAPGPFSAAISSTDFSRTGRLLL